MSIHSYRVHVSAVYHIWDKMKQKIRKRCGLVLFPFLSQIKREKLFSEVVKVISSTGKAKVLLMNPYCKTSIHTR